ncbi:MAG: hypothetical protein SynsKO_31820 [Synoicihabitans sp.]
MRTGYGWSVWIGALRGSYRPAFWVSRMASLVALAGLLLPIFLAAEADDGRLGWPDVRGKSTGWFHLESIRGRDVIVTPEGHGFVPLGVNHLNAIRNPGEGEHDLFSDHYASDAAQFRDDILQQFRAWGFNASGGSVAEINEVLPYFAAITLTRTSKFYGQPSAPNPYEFPDVFDPRFRAEIERKLRGFCETHRENPNLIAYYWTDTPTWDIAKTRKFRGTDWVSEIRKLGEQSPGKQRYLAYLKNRYDSDLGRFNRAYGVNLSDFTEWDDLDFNALDLTRYDILRDDHEFLGEIARTLYGIAGDAMRKFDPNHMVFGEKYLLGDIPAEVLLAAAPHLDAIAVQPGDGYLPIYPPGDIFPTDEVAKLHELTGLPVMICDHQVSFGTPRYPVSIWPYHQRENEVEAAAATLQFLEDAFARPYVVGYMRCQYIDRFSVRRNASKLGLLRDDGTPYVELLRAHREGYQKVRDQVRNSLVGPE